VSEYDKFSLLITRLLNNTFSMPPLVSTNGSMFMNHELERMWRDDVCNGIHPNICQEKLMKTMRNLYQDSHLPGLLGLEINIIRDLLNENNCR
jgi:hypothetical protein